MVVGNPATAPGGRGVSPSLSLIKVDEEAYRILISTVNGYKRELTPVQATDEIVSIFCALHGGLEEAMPIIRTQFKKAGVDFSAPDRKGLKQVVDKLVEVTAFLKGQKLAELERKRFEHIIGSIR